MSFLNEHVRIAGRSKHLWLRARMIQSLRRFFIEHNYLEVETPQLIPTPAPELHIDAISADNQYLHTSPELCMKRLLSAGYTKIFQICKCFRENERGEHHLPEFTLLEWYCTGIDYNLLMQECEDLILWVARDLGLGEKIYYQDLEIDLKRPWKKMSVSEAYNRYASLTLEDALKRGIFHEVMAEEIEPRLPLKSPLFLYDYPAPLAALARLKPDNPKFAERFEIFIGGLELANGFSELVDAQEQRYRFEKERKDRHHSGKKNYPMPNKFLKSLEHMPDAAGIALGVDRLAMIFSDRPIVDEIVTFTPEEL